jgi:DnaJ-class molecular chaperone
MDDIVRKPSKSIKVKCPKCNGTGKVDLLTD